MTENEIILFKHEEFGQIRTLNIDGEPWFVGKDIAVAYAIDQIVDLLSQGVDGIHLYTMNNAYVAERIYNAVYNLISVKTG